MTLSSKGQAQAYVRLSASSVPFYITPINRMESRVVPGTAWYFTVLYETLIYRRKLGDTLQAADSFDGYILTLRTAKYIIGSAGNKYSTQICPSVCTIIKNV